MLIEEHFRHLPSVFVNDTHAEFTLNVVSNIEFVQVITHIYHITILVKITQFCNQVTLDHGQRFSLGNVNSEMRNEQTRFVDWICLKVLLYQFYKHTFYCANYQFVDLKRSIKNDGQLKHIPCTKSMYDSSNEVVG